MFSRAKDFRAFEELVHLEHEMAKQAVIEKEKQAEALRKEREEKIDGSLQAPKDQKIRDEKDRLN
jgi:hypothetical protein